jgi:membrane protein
VVCSAVRSPLVEAAPTGTSRPRVARRFVRAVQSAASIYARTASGQRAAAISYHVLFSLVPFVALLVSVLELVLPESTQESVVSWLVGVASLPDEMADSVDAAIEDVGPAASFTGAIALAGLIWAASGMMGSIRSAFRAVWGSEADRPYLRGKLVDLVLVIGAGVLVVSAFGVSLVVQVITRSSSEIAEELGRGESATAGLGAVAQLVASLMLAFLAFTLLYRVVPPVPPQIRDAVPGALVAAAGVHLASAGFSVYLNHFSDFNDVYGPLGTVLAFLLLVYLAAVVLLFGACVAAAWPDTATESADGEPVALRIRLARAARGLVVREPGQEP